DCGGNDQYAAGVAKPVCGPIRRQIAATGCNKADGTHVQGSGYYGARPEADHHELGDPCRRFEGSAPPRPETDQIGPDNRCKGVARRNCDGQNCIGRTHVADRGGYMSGDCRCENCRPNAQSSKKHGAQAKAESRCNRNGTEMDSSKREV